MRLTLGLFVVLIAAGAAATSLLAQSGTTRGEWHTYGGDAGHTRYAPLDQINAANFSSLEVAWRFKTDNLGPRPEFMFQATPLMVGGRLYSTAGTRRAVVALDAGTGELLWVYGLDEGARGTAAPRQLSGRGLAYWSDGKDARILYVTPGYRLIALDAHTGRPVPTFGVNGIVDLKRDFDQEIDLDTAPVGLHATPMIADNVVIVGAAFQTGANPRSRTNVKGYVRGFDVRTGKRLWIFHTIPHPGEYGNDTWLNDSWQYSGNTGVWAQISVDETLGLAYLPVELPTHDYFGGERPGNNLFSESIVAIDFRTGQRKWHYQLVHHGLWDMDIPCAPILVDIQVDGRAVKALAQPTKQAFLYVLNRETGEPIWPFEERAVPKGDTPGEWYSPTQPFPTKPPAYDGQGLTIDDLIDFTPELRAEAIKAVERYRLGPIFTPPAVSRIEGPIATLTMSGQAGATNWPGGSYDPETRTVFVASTTTVSVNGLVPPPPGVSDLPWHQGTVLSGARRTAGAGAVSGAAREEAVTPGTGPTTVQRLPITRPPYSRITAIDLGTGTFRWQVPFGATPDFITNHPALKGLTLPPLGRPGLNAGTLVTKSLLIAGENNFGPTPSGARGAMLRAFDKATGQEVGAMYLPAPQSGSPMTYMHQGRQHLVIAVSGAGYSGELIAFRLPNAAPRAPDATQVDEVTVTPLIHSSVQLEHAGKVIHVDPWSRIDLSRVKPADLVLITDDVAHHLDPAAIARVRKTGAPVVVPKVGKTKVPDGVVLANGESGTFAGVRVEAIAAYDLTPGEPYHPKGEANGYVITLGAKRILIAGVTECVPELRAIKNIDIAFMPMNLPVQRMTPMAAAECTKVIAPKVVYVNHYDQDYASAAAKAGRVTETPGVARLLRQFADALVGSGIELRQAQWYPPLP